MAQVWCYTLLSVLIISLLSLIGVVTLSMDKRKLEKWLILLVSLSAGTLLGDAFFHLIPDSYQMEKNAHLVSLYILTGIFVFFILEKVIHWRHCHKIASEDHPHPFSYIILVGDTVHNFIDGLIIAASFLVSIPLGIATATAVIFHEIPQEIGNFGSLVYGGFSRKKALIVNLMTSLAAALGALLILSLNIRAEGLISILIPIAAGGFIYIASSDLIPELRNHSETRQIIGQILAFALGIAIMAWLLYIG